MGAKHKCRTLTRWATSKSLPLCLLGPNFSQREDSCSMVKLCLVFLPLKSKCHFLMLAVNNGSHLTFIDLNIFTLHRLDVFSSALVLNRCTCNLPISDKRQKSRRTFRIFPSQRTCTWMVENFRWFLNGFILLQRSIHVTSRRKTLNKA